MGKNLKYIGKILTVTIDRPLGTKHPEHDTVYPINYGYIADTKAPDGEEIDAYVLGVDKPLETFTGQCIAVIHRTNDNDNKLIVAPNKSKFSNKQIKQATLFQEKYFKSKILRSLFPKSLKLSFWSLIGFIVLAVAHNAVYALFNYEEPVFFTLSLIVFVIFVCSAIYNLIYYSIRLIKKDSE